MFPKFKDTLTVQKLSEEYLAWLDSSADVRLRFGQYICNLYLRKDTSFSELFYETNPLDAFHIILRELP